MATVPTVYHVEDDTLVRRTVDVLVNSVGIPYLGFPTVNAFLEAYQEGFVGCLITDLRLPGLSGLELVRHCTARKITLPIIVFSAHADVTSAVLALKAGAFDFLEKPCSEQVLLDTVQRALHHDAQTRQDDALHAGTEARLATLTPGEAEVLEHLLDGNDNKGIARALQISNKTVEARRSRLMQKMGCDSLAQMVAAVVAYRCRQPRTGNRLDVGMLRCT